MVPAALILRPNHHTPTVKVALQRHADAEAHQGAAAEAAHGVVPVGVAGGVRIRDEGVADVGVFRLCGAEVAHVVLPVGIEAHEADPRLRIRKRSAVQEHQDN